MLRSKSRTGSSELGKKSHKSALSRTLSASRFCRGDPLISQIDKNALKPVEKKSSTTQNSPKRQIVEIATMLQHVVEKGEELKNVKEQLNMARNERDRPLDELTETKIAVPESNAKRSNALSSPMKGEALKMKENGIKSSKVEIKKSKELEIERDVVIERLRGELVDAEASESRAMKKLSENKNKIQELENELERVKLSEAKMYDTVVSQTKQLEETKIELEESKLEVASLREELRKPNTSTPQSDGNVDGGDKVPIIIKEKKILKEMNSLKSELKSAVEAEEKSNKAMEDLALALKEVATEANQAKEELASTVEELSHVKDEAEQLKEMVRTIEDRYNNQLHEANKEIERYRNTAERLRLEAEESLLAWNDKEMGFVSCIKKAEEDNIRLVESLKEAQKSTKTSKDENFKLRDILKQALNEANVAKEAASIARLENSQLKDAQSEKDEALDNLAQENERLSSSLEELKRMLSAPSNTMLNNEEKDKRMIYDYENPKAEKNNNLGKLKTSNRHEDVDEKVLHEDPVLVEALKGSIFDNADSPNSEPRTPDHRRVPSPFEEKTKLEDGDHIEDSDSCDGENVRNSQRKGRALLRTFRDLMKRKNLNKKESFRE